MLRKSTTERAPSFVNAAVAQAANAAWNKEQKQNESEKGTATKPGGTTSASGAPKPRFL